MNCQWVSIIFFFFTRIGSYLIIKVQIYIPIECKHLSFRENHSPSYEVSNNDEDDDDIPQLSTATMAALQEFYAEQLHHLDSKSNASQNFQENWVRIFR